MADQTPGEIFALFTEIGIIEQLTRARLEARLPGGLIAPHFKVLNHLARVGDGSTPQRMARAFQVPKTSMTHTLQGLEKRGLIEMRPNPDDGRSKTVRITEAGQTLRSETIAALIPGFQKMLSEIGQDRLAEIRPVLTELRQYLDDNREG